MSIQPSPMLRPLLAVAGVALLAGCASTGREAAPAADRPAEEAVLERAAQRWELLVGGNFAEAWQYLSPGVRSARPRERYETEMAMRPVKWTAATPLGAECTPEPPACTVQFEIAYRIRSHLTGVGWLDGKSVVSERWIQLEDGWVHVPEEVAGG